MRRTVKVLPIVPGLVLIAGMLAAPASAAPPRCFGERATIVGPSRADVLKGTNRADVIVGLGGADTIRGGGRGDLICGGKGGDTIRGGAGIDLMFGDQGNDEIFGQGGFYNQAVPGAGNDFVDGGTGTDGNEVIYLDANGPITGDLGTGVITGFGNDEVVRIEWLIGSPFDDTLTGSDEDDALYGSDGNDTLTALGGDDFLAGGNGDDAVDGGTGFDMLGNHFFPSYYLEGPPAGPVTVDLPNQTLTGIGTDALAGIEGSQGSTGNDVMIGDGNDNEFTVLAEGSDTVDAAAGDDLVDGGEGVDDLDGGTGIDILGNLDAPTGMTIDLGAQTDSHGDTLAGFEDAIGTFFDDIILGSSGSNFIEGADGADDISGLDGNDFLFGGFAGFADPDPDSADGGNGTDQCDAETETNCETDPPATPSGAALGGSAKGLVYASLRF